MNNRLEQLMKAEGLTSAKFAEILSVQPSSISHLLSGRNKPNFDFISKLLLMFPTINPRWIINGQLPMYIDQNDEISSPELPLSYNVKTADIIDSNLPYTHNQSSQPQNVQSVNSVTISVESPPVDNQKSNIIEDKLIDASSKKEFMEMPIPSPIATSVQDPPLDDRSVQRVLLLYSDNSFEFFDSIIK